MKNNITTDPRPHLIPGIYSWLYENFSHVFFIVLVDHPRFDCRVKLPTNIQVLPVLDSNDSEQVFGHEFKTVTLNLGAEAVGKFLQDAEGFEVTMRFSQVATTIYIPFEAIASIHTPDNKAVVPFNFILRPGQENHSIHTTASKLTAVTNSQVMTDNGANVEAKTKVEGDKSALRECHLKLVQ